MCVHTINEDVNPGYWKNIIYVTHLGSQNLCTWDGFV